MAAAECPACCERAGQYARETPPRQAQSRPSYASSRRLLKEHAALLASAAQRLREFHPRFEKASDEEIFSIRTIGCAVDGERAIL
jgi:hypothetical protein